MKIIVGLGNPGPKYETTRHNVGFLAVDRLIDRFKAEGPFEKFQSEIYQTHWNQEKVYLIKPQTFMNLVGQSVGPIFQFYQCSSDDLIVIHDDLDLKPISFRIKTGGGTGGHNGLKSIDVALGKEKTDYHRIRIGIGHPSSLEIPLKISPASYVLQPFSSEELDQLDPLLDRVFEAVEFILKGQIRVAMNQFHRSERQNGGKDKKSSD